MRLRPRKIKPDARADTASSTRVFEFEPLPEAHAKRMRKAIGALLRAEKKNRTIEKRRAKRAPPHVCSKDDIQTLSNEHTRVKQEAENVEQQLRELEEQYYDRLNEIRVQLAALPHAVNQSVLT